MKDSCIDRLRGQDGLALLVFVIVLVFGAISYFLASLSTVDVKQYQVVSTSMGLRQAKQALISYAATYNEIDSQPDGLADFPGELGFLPCPDYNGGALSEGLEDNGNCGATSISKLGYLPWRTLGIEAFKDASGACLLYAVTGEYKNDEFSSSQKSLMLNEDSSGMFLVKDSADNPVTGATPDDRVVAIVFAPDVALTGQTRNHVAGSQCNKEHLNFAAYLDAVDVPVALPAKTIDNSSLNVDAEKIDEFIHAVSGSSELYNDRFVTITRKEIWDAVVSRKDFLLNPNSMMRRQTEAMARCIAAYGNASGNRKLPRPVTTNFGMNADYRIDSNYDDTSIASHLGRYPHTVNDSDTTLAGNAPNSAVPIVFNKGFCDAIPVPISGGGGVNLNTTAGAEGYRVWKNWKDHFFYAVSDYYSPSNAGDAGAPSCDGTNCITVNTIEYAAVVIYANSRVGLKTRNEPLDGDADTKFDLDNYIEVVNAVGNGTGDYTPTDNDIMYCITDTDPLDVVSCP